MVLSETLQARWYAVLTHPRHEKHLRDALILREIETFLPLYETRKRWRNGCTMTVQTPLFPNYLFVRIDSQHRVAVLSLPGIVRMVGSGSAPWPLPDDEIANLRRAIEVGRPLPHTYLMAGTQTRITSGPLAGLTGTVIRHNGELRIVLSVDIIRQSVSVEVGVDEIEWLGVWNRPGIA